MASSLLRSGGARAGKSILRLSRPSSSSITPSLTQSLFNTQSPPPPTITTTTTRHSSSTSSTMTASAQYLAAVQARRTYYPLKKASPIDDKAIQAIVSHAVLHAPSSFNSQSTRVVVLLNAEHDKLWDIAKDALKAVVPADQYPATEQKLSMFQGAYGTVSDTSSLFTSLSLEPTSFYLSLPHKN